MACATRILFFIYSISSASELSELDLNKRNSIDLIGSIHLKTSIIAIVPFFLGVIAKFIGDWSWEILIVLWYASFAVLIIFYIYWPMVNVHKLMKSDVENQVSIVQTKIQKLLKEINFNPSSRNFSKH